MDEFGPLEIRPYPGSCWAQTGKPQRLPATYTRHHGVRHLLGGYDLKTENLFGVIRKRKRSKEFLGFLKIIRRRYPIERRLILIVDNFSTHRTKDNLAWCENNGVWLIPTATNASWMNRIEAQFGAVHYFVLKNSYPEDHIDLERRIKEHLKWRNQNRHDPLLKKALNRTYVT